MPFNQYEKKKDFIGDRSWERKKYKGAVNVPAKTTGPGRGGERQNINKNTTVKYGPVREKKKFSKNWKKTSDRREKRCEGTDRRS